ncbi:MAG: four helix bundle protein [Flavobacteriaceae bacterium]|nr:four helix bundle protein [Flavobacteriaceae bacterium]
MKKYKFDLEERLIKFSVEVILFCKTLDGSFASIHLSGQLIRSSSSAALNYGEAQSAESHKDFIHKMKVCLKELRESLVNLKILKGAELSKIIKKLDYLIGENNELIAIFVSSIKTSKIKNKHL